MDTFTFSLMVHNVYEDQRLQILVKETLTEKVQQAWNRVMT